MMTPHRIAGVLVALAVVCTFAPRRRSDPDAGVTRKGAARIGLVFDVGGRGDKSFNDAAYIGLSRARRELGVETSYLEPTGSEDREAAMRLFAARGFDLVIAVGFIFSSDVDAVARAYPKVHFACVDYAPGKDGVPPNVAGLTFREEEGSFLVGALAGLVTKTKHVGFVGGMITPLIRKFEAGYEAGVKAACPECVVHSAYAGSTPEAFKDPSKGKSIAIAQIAAGADVLYHASGSTGHGVFEAARDAHVFAIGVDADQYDEMPEAMLTSMVKRADVAVFEAIKQTAEGHFVPGMHDLGLKDGAIDYVKDGPHAVHISSDVRARVEAFRDEIVAGHVRVPSR